MRCSINANNCVWVLDSQPHSQGSGPHPGIQVGVRPVSMLSQTQELGHVALGPQFPEHVGW